MIHTAKDIIFFMVVQNVLKKEELFKKVINQALKISNKFIIVNHGSKDSTVQFLGEILPENGNVTIYSEDLASGTMDDMKAKYYKILLEEHKNKKQYIFILDWDEVLDDSLVEEIKALNFESDVYLINRHTYFIQKVMDSGSYLPLLFEVSKVEINTFAKFHDLYRIHGKKIRKLKGILHHFSYENIDEVLSKILYYSKGEAQNLWEKNPSLSNFLILIKFIYESLRYFFYTLIKHKNYRHLEGGFASFSGIVYIYYKYLFYLEKKIKNTGIK